MATLVAVLGCAVGLSCQTGEPGGTGTASGGSTGDATAAAETTGGSGTGADCPPEPMSGLECEAGGDPEHCCWAEESAMYCCGLTFDSDPPPGSYCAGELLALANQPDTEHCVDLLTTLFACTSALGCEALEPYAVAAVNGGMPHTSATFSGLACEAEAVAVVEAGCPVVTTAILP